ncbi:prolyl oligopeptidase family serine peptidase [Garciella nitratireducens]|uniref:prolyl oligopeptidase family serine peptidase n=1 Tax=Garciella nitratireducens TaxID=218205 RepID=UPI001BD5FDEB|nr:prolyl oligopeptidase family serine peptidase [Garciella nitratireducens]
MIPWDLLESKKVTLNNVPCLIVRPTASKRKFPTLFHYHGWGSKKENHKFLGTIFALYGYQVILPDSNFHGDRNPLKEYTNENMMKYFWNIVNQSVTEFQEIKEEAKNFYSVDENAIAVSGSSMGGYIGSTIFAKNLDVQCLITFNGGSSWRKTEEVMKKYLDINIEKMLDREQAREFDPLTYKESFYPRPILMLHGDVDTSVPIEIQRDFYQEVVPFYQEDQDRICLQEYHNMNHHISIKMVESAVKWLQKYLNPNSIKNTYL